MPLAKLSAMMFVIVCDLPVPGGPCKTNDLPSSEYSTALSCDESALITAAVKRKELRAVPRIQQRVAKLQVEKLPLPLVNT